MHTQAICIPRAHVAEVHEIAVADPQPNQILLKTHYSIISPGTELAIFRDDFWSTLPHFPGYGAVGEVVKVGDEIAERGHSVQEGDLLFCYNGHASHSLTAPGHVIAPLPASVNRQHAVFTRMAAVAMTALRVEPSELGDWIAIQGLGLVGNFAAQLFQLAGAKVIGLEISSERRAKAAACGIQHIIDPSSVEPKEAIMELTKGKGVSTLIEATGVPSLVEPACDLIAKEGTLILLGSPRGELQTDVTSLLNQVHLWGNGCITFKGAHEWRYPIARQPNVKHSLQRNCELIVDMIDSGRLVIEPLLTHVAKPADCQQMYDGLREQPGAYLGVLFDWTQTV